MQENGGGGGMVNLGEEGKRAMEFDSERAWGE